MKDIQFKKRRLKIMSSYVCGNKTLSVLAKAMSERLGNDLTCAEIGGMPPIIIDALETATNIGNALLKQNQLSTYGKDAEFPEKFELDYDVPNDIKTIYGCMRCYLYQTSREGFENSLVYHDLKALEGKLIEQAFDGYPWGID